jgi:hypothetical protein
LNRRPMSDTHTTSTPTSSLCQNVIENVAQTVDESPASLDTPLYEVIDPDALERLFNPSADRQGPGRVTFEYMGCHVTVNSTGSVDVDPNEVGSGDSRNGASNTAE